MLFIISFIYHMFYSLPVFKIISQLGLASSRQNWYYRQQLMDNDRNLSSYDILIERRQTYTIDVKDC